MTEQLSLVAPINMGDGGIGPVDSRYVMTISDVDPKRIRARLTQTHQYGKPLDSERELAAPQDGNRLDININSYGPARITFVIGDKDASFAPQADNGQPQLAVVKREGDPDYLFDPQWEPNYGGPGQAVSVLLAGAGDQQLLVKYGLGIVIGDVNSAKFLSPIFFDPVIDNGGGPPPPVDPTD